MSTWVSGDGEPPPNGQFRTFLTLAPPPPPSTQPPSGLDTWITAISICGKYAINTSSRRATRKLHKIMRKYKPGITVVCEIIGNIIIMFLKLIEPQICGKLPKWTLLTMIFDL